MNNISIHPPDIQSLGEIIDFKDGTKYMRMPNGELRRMSPRPHKIRKSIKNK